MKGLEHGYVNESGEFVRGQDAPEREEKVESDSFESFSQDPAAKSVLETVSLEYLKTHDQEFFEREFTGELDSDGYLIRKDGGNPITTPSMNIGGGKAMEQVIQKVKEELQK